MPCDGGRTTATTNHRAAPIIHSRWPRQRASRQYLWVTERLVVELLHGITSPDRVVRERSADEVTDVHKGLPLEDVAALSYALVATRLVEADERCQESQLHALAELAEWHDLPAEAVRRLATLRPTSDPSQLEYLDDLLGT